MKIGSKDYEIYDESRKCAKCGKTGASSEYVYKNPLCFFETPNIPNEFIERTCLNCGYKWWELPADYKDKHEARRNKSKNIGETKYGR